MKLSILFSLVLYKHKFSAIQPLLLSLNELALKYENLSLTLSVVDNSFSSDISENEISGFLESINLYYTNSPNIGFGQANNLNFSSANGIDHDIFIVVNPDIYFDPSDLYPFLIWFHSSSGISCAAPLILNPPSNIQFSVKTNPTFLSLFLGRLPVFKKFQPFFRYYANHIHLNMSYRSMILSSTYLSGCFMAFTPNIYSSLQGFDKRFFLHLEDADITRRASQLGSIIHNPIGVVYHRWARGSHKSFKQSLLLLKSYYTYVRIWGFSLI